MKEQAAKDDGREPLAEHDGSAGHRVEQQRLERASLAFARRRVGRREHPADEGGEQDEHGDEVEEDGGAALGGGHVHGLHHDRLGEIRADASGEQAKRADLRRVTFEQLASAASPRPLTVGSILVADELDGGGTAGAEPLAVVFRDDQNQVLAAVRDGGDGIGGSLDDVDAPVVEELHQAGRVLPAGHRQAQGVVGRELIGGLRQDEADQQRAHEGEEQQRQQGATVAEPVGELLEEDHTDRAHSSSLRSNKSRTCTGNGRSMSVPSPSWRASLAPQHHTASSAIRAHVWE